MLQLFNYRVIDEQLLSGILGTFQRWLHKNKPLHEVLRSSKWSDHCQLLIRRANNLPLALKLSISQWWHTRDSFCCYCVYSYKRKDKNETENCKIGVGTFTRSTFKSVLN